LSDAPYYAYRAGGGSTSARDVPAGYEAELLHHKLYLDDPTPPVEHFEVTHGYNLITANAVRPADRLSIRFGIGVVIAHAEGRIAGQRVGGSRRTLIGGGYHVAGITAQVAAGRRYALARGQVVTYALPEPRSPRRSRASRSETPAAVCWYLTLPRTCSLDSECGASARERPHHGRRMFVR
jgi:hypothetical protein